MFAYAGRSAWRLVEIRVDVAAYVKQAENPQLRVRWLVDYDVLTHVMASNLRPIIGPNASQFRELRQVREGMIDSLIVGLPLRWSPMTLGVRQQIRQIILCGGGEYQLQVTGRHRDAVAGRA